MSAVTLLAC